MTSSSWKWKTWLLSNFEHCEGKLVAVREILAEGEKIKEKVGCSASSTLFGHLIKQIWGDKVRLVKRGSRKQRENYYLGLTRKSPTSLNDSTDENQRISQLKTGWHLVSDQGGNFTFARYEPWSFRKQRVVTEVRFVKEDESYSILLTSHGCQIDLTTVSQLECLEQSPIRKRIESILTFIDTSTLCRGVPITDGEDLHSTIPLKSGIYSDLSTNRTTETVEYRAFPVNCVILSSAGQCCSNCKNLHNLEKKRQKRKLETNGVISPFTNKRFLSKEDVTKQLQLERQARLNAEKRERYWREKCESEGIEMENDDHADKMLDQPEELGNNEEDNTATGLVSFAGVFWDVKKRLQGRLQQEKLEDARKELAELNRENQEVVQSQAS